MAIHYREEQQISLGSRLGLIPLNNGTRTSILNGIVGSQRSSSTVPNQPSWPRSRLHNRTVLEPLLYLLGREHLKGPRGHEPFPVWAGLSDLEVESGGFDL